MEAGTGLLGSVVAIWRYPIKSMQGEKVNETVITERGLLGDRAYAIIDRATGHIASAKHPRKWHALFQCRARFVEPPQPDGPLPDVWIELPDGHVINSAQADVDDVLSRVLSRDVALTAQAPAEPMREADRSPVDGSVEKDIIMQERMALAAPDGTFFDYAPVHILTTATIDRLRALYPAGRFDVRRFRPNIVVAPVTDESDFVENQWLGRDITIGAQVRLHIIDPCPRCVVTTLAQGDLPHDPGILRTASQHNAVASATLAPGVVLPAVVGVYATVLMGGNICRSDRVTLD